MTKLNLEEKVRVTRGSIAQDSNAKSKRQLSDSSRGSIGRRERLRNALTGQADAGDGADKPKDLPRHELVDFLGQYDRTEPGCCKIIRTRVERETNDSLFDHLEMDPDSPRSGGQGQGTSSPLGEVDLANEAPPSGEQKTELSSEQLEGGEELKEQILEEAEGPVSSDGANSQYRIVEEVTFPSLDDALELKFDLNNITNIQQRHRNLNCQPRLIQDLYPAPLHLLTKREKRCKECHKFVIKPNANNPTSSEKLKTDHQMIYYVPKVMIYRTGKYTPYKGPT